MWHFGLHRQVGLATTLARGRERAYFDYFFDTFSVSPDLVGEGERAFYAELAAMPGALEAMFSTYAALDPEDAPVNARELALLGRLELPVLGISGAASVGEGVVPLLADPAVDARTQVVPDAAHYLLEERPGVVADLLRDFVAQVG